MIENVFIKESIQRQLALEYLYRLFKDYGMSSGKIIKTPIGDKVIIYAFKPNLIIKNFNLSKITKELKEKFKLENPFIDMRNINTHPDLDPVLVGQRICRALEVQGVRAYKKIGYNFINRVIRAGAYGVEIRMSGKIRGDRASSQRFFYGYLPKVGEIVQRNVKYANVTKTLKPGVISVDVFILPPDAILPDEVKIKEEIIMEEIDEKGQIVNKEVKEIKNIKKEEVDEKETGK